jgi:hypothetical protein
MTTPARGEPFTDETYLPREDAAEVIDFLSALQERGRQTADIRPRLIGPDGRSVAYLADHARAAARIGGDPLR